MFKSILVLLIAALIAIPAKSQTADEIIQKSLKASGYSQNAKSINTLKITGKMTMMGMEMTFVIKNKKPAKNKMEMEIMGQTMVQCINGDDSWMINPMSGSNKAEKLPKEQVEKAKNQNDFLNNALDDYKAKGTTIDYLGKENFDGKACYKLKVKTKDGEESLMYIDSQNDLAYAINKKMSAMGKEMEITMYFKDYKKVGEILMAHTIDTKADGQDQMQMVWEKVEVNIPIPDEDFNMPAE
ncbi:MAG: outer membrane lipoprotein-sorting protein [Bacteroidota bacterium]